MKKIYFDISNNTHASNKTHSSGFIFLNQSSRTDSQIEICQDHNTFLLGEFDLTSILAHGINIPFSSLEYFSSFFILSNKAAIRILLIIRDLSTIKMDKLFPILILVFYEVFIATLFIEERFIH
ncbi:hypothetical protein C7H79_13770 [Nitrosomonas supralitoralis]|uniref:Uncharacterized protein n=1 Tax=Nitrosomonas supralitoralis TaxID=2116706 RepID=A0A2P7NSF8_9PROT|nr:hypothetical protein C7H79_13770 [Nitrosomonas supralitoralis]